MERIGWAVSGLMGAGPCMLGLGAGSAPSPCSIMPGRGQEAIIFVLDRPVTGTGGGFQTSPVKDGDLAAIVLNKPGLLQHGRRKADRRPVHAKHLGKELLGEGKRIRLHPVMGLQEPAGAARVNVMKAIAGRVL